MRTSRVRFSAIAQDGAEKVDAFVPTHTRPLRGERLSFGRMRAVLCIIVGLWQPQSECGAPNNWIARWTFMPHPSKHPMGTGWRWAPSAPFIFLLFKLLCWILENPGPPKDP